MTASDLHSGESRRSGDVRPADPLPLAEALIGCASVMTADGVPEDGAAQRLLAARLARLGFDVTALPFGPEGRRTPNLFARLGSGAPHLCFAGHTDVVPPGDAGWTSPAFTPTLRDGRLYGRGAVDMKGAIAAFVAACEDRLVAGPVRGSISLLITGDEEGPATHGTRRVLDWLAETGQVPDFCLVGEPTNPDALGEMIKIGRRGSLGCTLTVRGKQGHVAYPQRADNPVHRLVAMLAELCAHELDRGTAWFEPSRLQVTSIDVGNQASNVIPGQAQARLNIRFNDSHSGDDLADWLRTVAARHAPDAELAITVSGEPFRTEATPEVAALQEAIAAHTGRAARLDTGGGTSDARFIARFCPVAEFGLVGATMHQADEHVGVDDLRRLSMIYGDWLYRLLPQPGVNAA